MLQVFGNASAARLQTQRLEQSYREITVLTKLLLDIGGFNLDS